MSYSPNNPNGQATMANSAPVVIASNQSAIPITDNSGSITIDSPVGTPAYVRLSDGASAITTLPVSMATNTPVGTVAHDAADSGAPVKIGGRARSSEITAVANDDRSDLMTDLVGKLIVLPYANPENQLIGTVTTSMTGTTDTAVSGMGAQGAGIRNYVTSVIVSNAHATVGTDVVFKDGSGGTVLGTFPAAALYGGVAITLGTPFKTSANTALYVANITTGASTKVTCYGYKGA